MDENLIWEADENLVSGVFFFWNHKKKEEKELFKNQ